MTPELENAIIILSDKFETIKSLHTKALEVIEQQNEKIAQITALVEDKEKEYEQLEKKYESLKLAKVIAASAGEAHDAKIKLNRIVREIDKCISLLNK